jgi:hypothetical protein
MLGSFPFGTSKFGKKWLITWLTPKETIGFVTPRYLFLSDLCNSGHEFSNRCNFVFGHQRTPLARYSSPRLSFTAVSNSCVVPR